jgi:hypothetical protein
MAELTEGKQYSYYDARSGTRYLAHTCTDRDEEDRVSGEGLRYTIMEGGDHTQSKKKVLGSPVMGSGRG